MSKKPATTATAPARKSTARKSSTQTAEKAQQKPAADDDAPRGLVVPPHPVLRYSTLRLVIFFIVFGLGLLLQRLNVLPLTGQGGVLLLLALALIVSGALSYALLSRQRDAMSSAIVNRLQRIKTNLDTDAAGEDEIPKQASPAE